MHKHAFAFPFCGHPWYHVHSFNMHMHNLKKKTKQNKIALKYIQIVSHFACHQILGIFLIIKHSLVKSVDLIKNYHKFSEHKKK